MASTSATGDITPNVFSVTELVQEVAEQIVPTLKELINQCVTKQFEELKEPQGRAEGIPNWQEQSSFEEGRAKEKGTQDRSWNGESVDQNDDISILSEGELDPYEEAKMAKNTWEAPKVTADKLNKFLKMSLSKEELKNITAKCPLLSNPVAVLPKVENPFIQMLHNRGKILR